MYVCGICGNEIAKEAHGGIPPSTGDHDSAFHVARAYDMELWIRMIQEKTGEWLDGTS